MKMLIKLVFALIVLVIAAFIGLVLYIDAIAKKGVQRGATYALQVETTVESVDVGLLSAQVELEDLEVDNPDPYDGHFLKLGEAEMAVSLGSLRQDNVVVPRFILEDLDVTLIRRGQESNYGTILESLQRFQSEEPSPDAKKFIIREIVINNLTVTADLVGIGGGLTKIPVRVEQVTLRDVPSKDEGGTIGEISGIIIKEVLRTVVKQAGDRLPLELTGELTNQLSQLQGLAAGQIEVLGQVQIGEFKKTVEETFGQMEQVGEQFKETGREVTQEVEKLKEGFGGLGGLLKKKDQPQDTSGTAPDAEEPAPAPAGTERAE